MRLPAREGEAIDRGRELGFTFADSRIVGFAGDTIGSALYASGRRVFSRSFKYHRPRGLLCCSGHCANCMMTVDGIPNVRVCVEPLREGAVVAAQNVLGSLERDLLAVTDRVGGPFTPVGFYYRTMIRPRRLWPVYEKVLRNVAGLGRVGGASRRYDTEHRRAEVLVIGGGRSGREAARAAASAGRQVVLVDEGAQEPLPGVEVLAPAQALGLYEGGLVPVDAGAVLYRFRAERIVVATGTVEQPLVFPGNDLAGVVLPNAVRRLVGEWSIRPGERAAVLAADDRGLEAAELLAEAGVDVALALRITPDTPLRIEATGRRGRVRRVTVDGRSIECDLLVMSGGRQPAYSLLAQAGARVEYDATKGIFVPTGLPAGIEAVGAVTGEVGGSSIPQPVYAGKGKCFVCVCEDVTDKDMKRALAEGFDSLE
ncbi:MAG: (2Fe-2S)-binding protein, partial [Actinobacteria bacterium]|nr:(2Fe-2S)-binding protein [Actinomycetota bacterium]